MLNCDRRRRPLINIKTQYHTDNAFWLWGSTFYLIWILYKGLKNTNLYLVS